MHFVEINALVGIPLTGFAEKLRSPGTVRLDLLTDASPVAVVHRLARQILSFCLHANRARSWRQNVREHFIVSMFSCLL